jgi:WD40 repeat protein
VVFSGDGKHIATRSSGSIVRTWDAETGRLLATIPERHADIRFGDWDTLLTTGNRFPLRAWSVTTGAPLPHPIAVTGDGTAFAGESFVLVRTDKALRVVDTRTGAAGPTAPVVVAGKWSAGNPGYRGDSRPAVGRGGLLPAAVLNRAGDGLFLADTGGARLWDLRAGKAVATLAAGSRYVEVAGSGFSPDAHYLVAVFLDDELFHRWDGRTGTPLAPLGPVRGPAALAFSPDSRLAYRTDLDRVVGWDLAGGVPAVATATQPEPVTGMVLSPDGRWVATAGRSAVRIWGTTGPTGATDLAAGSVEQVESVSADGTAVLAFGPDDTLRVFRLPAGTQAGPPITAGFLEGAISPDGRTAVVPGAAKRRPRNLRTWSTGRSHHLEFAPPTLVEDGDGLLNRIGVWDTATGQARGEPIPTGEPVWRIGFSSDGRRFFTAGTTHVRIWDVGTRHLVGEAIPYDSSAVEALGFGPDGEQLAHVENGRTLRLCKVLTPAEVRTATFPAPIARADFRPDGRYLLVSCTDGSVHLWDVGNWRPAGAFSAPPRAHAGLFAPDGETFLAPHWDRRLFPRRVPTTDPAGPSIEQPDPISVALFIPGRRLLATASDRDIRLWHGPTGRRIGPVLHVEQFPRERVPALWWQGGRLVAHTRARALRSYPITGPITDPPDRVERRVQALTGMELRAGNVRILDRHEWAKCRNEFPAGGDPDPAR